MQHGHHHQSTRGRRSRFTNGVTEQRKGFRRQQTHDGDRSPDVSYPTSHCFPEYAEKPNTCSHFTECAEKPGNTCRISPSARRTGSNKSRISQSTWMDQIKDSVLLEGHKSHGFELLRVRGQQLVLGRDYQAGTVRYTRKRSTTPKRMTMNDANKRSIFHDGLTKGQLLNQFCGHQCNLTTLLDLCTDDKTAQREGYRKMHKTENQGTRFHVSEVRVQHWSRQGTGHTP